MFLRLMNISSPTVRKTLTQSPALGSDLRCPRDGGSAPPDHWRSPAGHSELPTPTRWGWGGASAPGEGLRPRAPRNLEPRRRDDSPMVRQGVRNTVPPDMHRVLRSDCHVAGREGKTGRAGTEKTLGTAGAQPQVLPRPS